MSGAEVHNSILFRLLLSALLLLFVAHRAYYARKLPPDEAGTVSKMPSGPMTAVAGVFAILALGSSLIFAIAPALVSWAAAPFSGWQRWLGLFVAAAGFGLLEWSHRALAANWSDHPRLTSAQELVQTGPYQWIRHPMYTAFLLILGSTLLISANWLVGLSWFLSVAFDAFARIRFEETTLKERFGSEYVEYARKSGRLLPKMRLAKNHAKT